MQLLKRLVIFMGILIVVGVVALAYAIYRKDPVFILGQCTGAFVYLRNLWFIYHPPAET